MGWCKGGGRSELLNRCLWNTLWKSQTACVESLPQSSEASELLRLLSPGLDTKGPPLAKTWNSILIYVLYFIFPIKSFYVSNSRTESLQLQIKKKDTKSQSILVAVNKGPLCLSFWWLVHSENKHCVQITRSEKTLWVTLTNELFCLRWCASPQLSSDLSSFSHSCPQVFLLLRLFFCETCQGACHQLRVSVVKLTEVN